MMSIQGSSLPVTSSPSPSCPQTPVKSVALLTDPSVTELCGGTVSESAAPETIASPSSTPGSATLQQNSSSNCNRLNQSFTGTSSSDVGQPCGTKQLLELSTQQQQPASQHQQPHQSQMQASIQDSLQQDQLPPTQQLLQQAEQNQHLQHQNQQLSQNQQLQQLQQSQQLGHLGQQLQLGQHIQTTSHLLQGQHFHVGQQHVGQQQQQQLQQTLQLQQGQQLLQSQQLQQLIQQQGQQLLHGQPSQVQQLLQQQQQVSQQQLMQQQHVEQQHHQSPQLFLQHQGQSVMQQQQQQQGQSILQPQGQSVMQQSTGQPQYQNSQRFLPSSTQHLMSQHGGGQQLLQQSQLMQQQPLQQQILQQTSQQQLVNHIQPAGQQLYQPGMFQQQSNQQLLQAQLLQSQPGQQLLQQQSFQLNQQQQQQQTQQQLLQTQQLNSLQQQIVLQAIQAQGLGNLSGIAGRSLSLVPSGSSIGLVNTVPATVYRHLGSTVGTSSTTLTTQISKGNLVTGSRVALSGQSSSSSAQRPTTVQVVQQRQNAPLFIGQFGMVSNGTIIPSGIVPLGRPQAASGSVNVQASGGQPQILASPTQIQLAAAPLLGSAGNILNQQTLQVAMAQIQPQQQSPGANLLTSQQPLYIQTGLSVADGNGTISSMTLPRFTTASGHTHPLGLSMSLPVQIPVGVAGLGQAVTAKPASWSVSANAVASSCSAFQMEAGQLKMNTVPGCSDLTHSLTIESIPLSSLAQSCAEIGGQNYAVSLGFDSQLSLAPQVHLVTGLLSAKSPLDTTDNRRNSMKPEDFTNSSMALGDCAAAPDQTTKDCELNNVAANPEKQTAKVMPQILTHIIEGFVIQEGPEPFPVQRSSFMREYLDSTDEMTDSSCEGQSDEADDKMKVAVNAVTPKEVQDAPPRQTHIAKEATKCCVHCAKEYEPPAFGKMGKFCSVSCAKRSAATSRWTMYHVNKQNEAASPGKQSTTRRRSSNVNGRGWIRTNESRNTVSAQLQRYSQMSMSGVSGGTQVSTAAPAAVAPRAVTAQMTAVHAPPRVAFDSSAVSAEHETGLSFQQQQQQQQRTPPAQVLTSPRQDWTEVMHRAAPPPAVSRDSLGEGSDPTLRPPSEWSVQDVYTFVKNLPGCGSYADEFRLQEIDGQALLLLKEDHFMTTLNLKLGPALKICQQIAALKDSFS